MEPIGDCEYDRQIKEPCRKMYEEKANLYELQTQTVSQTSLSERF